MKLKGCGVYYSLIQYIRYAWFVDDTQSTPDVFTYTNGKPNWKRYYKFD
jgi:uncharacterized protein RhaS with RHS repeats